jgi:response regulator RpfG family c-di-GMP phosphodiesterase
MDTTTTARMRVMIVDDSMANLMLVAKIVKGLGHEPVVFTDPLQAFADALRTPADLVVSDFVMPGMNGLELVDRLRGAYGYEDVPMVMISGSDDSALRYQALDMGVTDFLRKPIDVAEVKARLRNLLKLREAQASLRSRAESLDREVLRATAALSAREEEVILRLSRAAEYRDGDTGAHIVRMAKYCRIVGGALGLDDGQCQTLFLASPMHDIGKIAVSDAILLKPGKLTADERSVMEMHTLHGFQILSGSDSDLIRQAAEIAVSHHERWDGTGYPARIKGEAIPLYGRIAAVADVFDALTNARPYKIEWAPDEALAYMKACAGQHFDPACIQAFTDHFDAVLAVGGAQGEAAVVEPERAAG